MIPVRCIGDEVETPVGLKGRVSWCPAVPWRQLHKLLSTPGIRKSSISVRSKVVKSSYGWYLGNALPEQ
jgi:hypothetical protein